MENKKTLSILSLVFGIISWSAFIIPIGFLSIFSAIAAIVLGIVSKKREEKNGMRIAGLVLGIIYLALFITGIILIMALGSAILDMAL